MKLQAWMLSPVIAVLGVLFVGFFHSSRLFEAKPRGVGELSSELGDLSRLAVNESSELSLLLTRLDRLNLAVQPLDRRLNRLAEIPSISYGETSTIEQIIAESERRDAEVRLGLVDTADTLKSVRKEAQASAEASRSVQQQLGALADRLERVEATELTCPQESSIPFWALVVAILAMVPAWITLFRKSAE